MHLAKVKNTDEKKRIYLSAFSSIVLVFILSGFITLVSLFIQPGSFVEVIRTFLAQPLLILLNWFPPLVLTAVLYFLIGNVFYGGAIAGTIISVMSYINLLKIEGREDTFVPADITLVREAMNAVEEYELPMHYGKIALIVLFAAIAVVLGIFIKSWKPKWYARVAGILAAALVFAGAVKFVYSNRDLYSHFKVPSEYNIASVFNTLGFNYCFLYNYELYPIDKPEGFSKAEVESWDHAESNAAPAVRPNVLMVMCEAFSDLSDEDMFAYTEEENPLFLYHQIASGENAISGHIVVTNYGAGTANTEFDVLTGIQTSMVSERLSSSFRIVRRNTRNIASVFTDNGYHTFFMHPGESWFYNRSSVYEHFGITDQTFSDAFDASDYKGRMISDAAFLDELKSELEHDVESPYFGYTVTIENHQNYNYDKFETKAPPVPLNVSVSDAAAEQLAVYMEGVRDSSEMLYELTEYLEAFDEPTILVFFGDHRPNVGSACDELGLHYNENRTSEDTIATYTVPYVIWTNSAYADQVDVQAAFNELDLPKSGYISSNYLGAMTLELCGFSDGDAFFTEVNQLRRELPVIRSIEGIYMQSDGSFVTELTEPLQEQVERIKMWNYYILKC